MDDHQKKSQSKESVAIDEGLDPSIYRYIMKFSYKEQIIALFLTVISFPLLYVQLELPKIIVNDVLKTAQDNYLLWDMDFDRVSYLMILCFAFLGFVFLVGILKMVINTLKGFIGERIIRRLRYNLLSRSLRFPLSQFSKISQGELISSITLETEALAGFICDSYVLPVYQGGIMLTIIAFMFIQDPLLGIAAILLIPVQAYLIPKLQKKVNQLGKQRVKAVRALSERIGESVDNIRDIRSNGTQRYTLAQFSDFLGRIFLIRSAIYKQKNLIKFLNNLINQLTPFFFYSIGGYLVITNQLTLGTLVAAIAAYQHITNPWKELLKYYQTLADSRIKYDQVIAMFSPLEGLEKSYNSGEDIDVASGNLELKHVNWSNQYNERILKNINLNLASGQLIGIEAKNSTELRSLAEIIAQLSRPDSGDILIDGHNTKDLSAESLGKAISYALPEPKLFSGSIMQNITYGLRHIPPEEEGGELSKERRLEIKESQLSGNSIDHVQKVWTDFNRLKIENWEGVRKHWSNILDIFDDTDVIYKAALKMRFDPEKRPKFADKIIESRVWLRDRLNSEGLGQAIEPFDINFYLHTASVYENIFFGLAPYDQSIACPLSEQPLLHDVLKLANIWPLMLEGGYQFAQKLIDTFDGEDNHSLRAEELTYISEEKFETLAEIFPAIDVNNLNEIKNDHQTILVGLFLLMSPLRDGTELLSNKLQNHIMSLRQSLLYQMQDSKYPNTDHLTIRFDVEKVHPNLSVIDNLLFGRIVSEDLHAIETIHRQVDLALKHTDSLEALTIILSLDEVGVGGSKLPIAAKHKISFSRGLMKQPKIYIMQQVFPGTPKSEQAAIIERSHAYLPNCLFIVIDEILPDLKWDHKYRLDQGYLVEYSQKVITDEDKQQAEPVQSAQDGMTENKDEIIRLISRAQIFSDLPQQYIHQLTKTGEWRNLKANDYVYRSGDKAEYIFLLKEGLAGFIETASDGSEKLSATAEAGESFGALELLGGTLRFTNLKAITDIRILRINGRDVLRIAEDNPKIGIKVLEMLGKRLTRENDISTRNEKINTQQSNIESPPHE